MIWRCAECGEVHYRGSGATLHGECSKCGCARFQNWDPKQEKVEPPQEVLREMKWFCSSCGWEFLLVLGATLPGECPKCHGFKFQSWDPHRVVERVQ